MQEIRSGRGVGSAAFCSQKQCSQTGTLKQGAGHCMWEGSYRDAAVNSRAVSDCAACLQRRWRSQTSRNGRGRK